MKHLDFKDWLAIAWFALLCAGVFIYGLHANWLAAAYDWFMGIDQHTRYGLGEIGLLLLVAFGCMAAGFRLFCKTE